MNPILFFSIGLLPFTCICLVGIYSFFSFQAQYLKAWLYDMSSDFSWDEPYVWKQLGKTDPTIVMPLAMGCIIVWPIIFFVGIIFSLLYLLRGFIRFKTKVNKAMENTDKEGHTHEY
jgi:hypothetical protein